MSTDSVPVIDIRSLQDVRTLRALDAACRDWGFFQVVEHGIENAVLQALEREMRNFFAQPQAAKRTIRRSATNPWGYFDDELTKNTFDWKEVFDYGPGDGSCLVPQWPDALPGFRLAILDYYQACLQLSMRLLAALSVNLGMPDDHLVSCFKPEHSSFVRLNYYPICPQPARPAGLCVPEQGHLGVNYHTDAGALTVLFQSDQAGLEVYNGGTWHVVVPHQGALVVNVGDIVQVWSNDRYTAALHRVAANADALRFSAPFFLNPAYTANYAPLPSVIDAAHPPRYGAINWGEFRDRRAAGDYADQGEEVQISHYKV